MVNGRCNLPDPSPASVATINPHNSTTTHNCTTISWWLRTWPQLHPTARILHHFVWSRIDGEKWFRRSRCGWWPENLAGSHHRFHHSEDGIPELEILQYAASVASVNIETRSGAASTRKHVSLKRLVHHVSFNAHITKANSMQTWHTFKACVTYQKWLLCCSHRLRPLLECRNQPRHSFDLPHIPELLKWSQCNINVYTTI